MTDREVLTEMLTRAGVVFRETDLIEKHKAAGRTGIFCQEGDGPRNEGYTSFVAAFTFEPDGSLYSVGAWE
jgi:hypothetical protein